MQLATVGKTGEWAGRLTLAKRGSELALIDPLNIRQQANEGSCTDARLGGVVGNLSGKKIRKTRNRGDWQLEAALKPKEVRVGKRRDRS